MLGTNPNHIFDDSGKNHKYADFISLIKSELKIQWDDNTATITLASGHTLTASFSYNEPKIYFGFAGNSFRVLSDGQLAFDAVMALNIQMEAANKMLRFYEG